MCHFRTGLPALAMGNTRLVDTIHSLAPRSGNDEIVAAVETVLAQPLLTLLSTSG